MASRSLLFLLAVLALGGCAGQTMSPDAEALVAQYQAEPPGPERFPYCYTHGCQRIEETGLTTGEWAAITGLFVPVAEGPEAERARIAAASALFERSVGARIGTAGDVGGTFTGMGRVGQLDCVDEATNTTLLLTMLAAEGLLRWHDVGPLAHRGMIIDRWPHVTATVIARHGGGRFTVDTWFFDNGQEAVVVPVKQWMDGWSPA